MVVKQFQSRQSCLPGLFLHILKLYDMMKQIDWFWQSWGYPLAECQISYYYYDGLGAEKDLKKALYWTRRAVEHGDRDG